MTISFLGIAVSSCKCHNRLLCPIARKKHRFYRLKKVRGWIVLGMGRLQSQRKVITLLFIQIVHIIISFLRSQFLHSWKLTSSFFNERKRKDRTRWKAWQKTTSFFFFFFSSMTPFNSKYNYRDLAYLA